MARRHLILSLGFMASSSLCFATYPVIGAPSIGYVYEYSAQELKQEQKALNEILIASQKIINQTNNLTQEKEKR
ncbi:MAG: hypothetical protein O2809_08515 [Proteobacteria bacterium]|nr:hypothetical protein [Pseudomonadota bacterium]